MSFLTWTKESTSTRWPSLGLMCLGCLLSGDGGVDDDDDDGEDGDNPHGPPRLPGMQTILLLSHLRKVNLI